MAARGRSASTRASSRTRWSPGRVSWREWLGLAAGVLAVVTLFLPWTELHAADPEVRAALAELPRQDVSRSVWDSTFLAWLPPLVLAVAGVAVVAFGQFRSVRVSGLPQLWLVAAVVAVCAMVSAWVFIEWQFGPQQRAFLADSGVDVTAGFGRYLACIALAASLCGAFLDVRAGIDRVAREGAVRRDR